jgi:hypothetical protein
MIRDVRRAIKDNGYSPPRRPEQPFWDFYRRTTSRRDAMAFTVRESALDLDVGVAGEALEDPGEPEQKREPKSLIQLPVQHSVFVKAIDFVKVLAPHRNPLFASAIILALASACNLFFWLRSGPRHLRVGQGRVCSTNLASGSAPEWHNSSTIRFFRMRGF